MKNKGFTLVELITTFVLTSVIILLLINILNVIKTIYSKSNIKTELYINQGNLSNVLNKKINNNNLERYEECYDSFFCFNFYFVDGEKIKLQVEDKKIEFGNYVYNLESKTRVVNPKLNIDNNILNLKIPIKNEIYPDIDFGINLVYFSDISGG